MAIEPDEEVPQHIATQHIIDHDLHLGPRPEHLHPYVEDDMVLGKLQKIAESHHTSFHGHPPDTLTLHQGAAISGVPSSMDERGHQLRDGEDVIKASARMGVDTPVVAPELFFLPSSNYPVLTEAIVRAYNDYVLDDVVAADDAVKAWALLPQWNPEEMVAELDRVGQESEFVGAYTVFDHSHAAFGAREYDPVFEKLVELGLPLAIHGGQLHPHDTPVGESVRTWSEGMGVHWTANAMIYMANMINTGVFDKFPELDVLIQEPGFTWVPFFAQHMDELVGEHPEDIKITPRMYEMDAQYLEKRPSEYVADNFYFDTQPFSLTENEQHARSLLEMCRADERLTFSSDWPHHSMDMPWTVSEHPAINSDLQENIFSANSRQLLRL